MTDDNVAINVITMVLCKGEATDAQSMHPEQNQPPQPVTERRMIVNRQKRCEQVKGKSADEGPRLHWMYGDGLVALEDDDSGGQNKVRT